KPVANPLVVLREEFDDWAVLFDPDVGNAFGLNPVGVFIWKRLDGNHTIQDILKKLNDTCEDLPEEAEEHLRDLIKDMVEKGLVGYEAKIA
ncbi:MAG: SynChlorMet cassette protein ScmD, partial [Gemmatimonadales bacterium]